MSYICHTLQLCHVYTSIHTRTHYKSACENIFVDAVISGWENGSSWLPAIKIVSQDLFAVEFMRHEICSLNLSLLNILSMR